MSLQDAFAAIMSTAIEQAVEDGKLSTETSHPAMLNLTFLFDAPTLDEAMTAAQDTLKAIEAAHPTEGMLKTVNSAIGGGVVMPKKHDEPAETIPDHLAGVLDGALNSVLDGMPSLEDYFHHLRSLVE